MQGKEPVKQSDSFLSLGSNLGDRMGYLKGGIESIAAIPGITLEMNSNVYETDPVGVTDQPAFLNMAVKIVTSLEPAELLAELKSIENRLGRLHRERWREREIDIDIIFYGNSVVSSEQLTIPHERAHTRRFVLQPLADIAPDFEHPVLHKTVKELLVECADKSGVSRFREIGNPVV